MSRQARLALAVAAVVASAACARPPARCPAAGAPAAPSADAAPAEGPLPPPDDQLARWQAIRAAGDAPPDGTTAAALVPELLDYLASPDPARRDAIGFEVLAKWIVLEPRLDPAEVRALVAPLTALLAGPLAAPDGVYGRSFAALALSLVVARDLADPAAPVLDAAARRDLLAAARAYADREDDLRGHTGAKGWAHAAAHTADLLKFLARAPTFTDDDRAVVLDAVAALVVRRHGFNLHHGEDSRLALPVLEAVRRGIATTRLDAWVDAIAAPLREPWPDPFDPALYAAQRNARNLLVTLYAQLALMPEPAPPAAAHLLERIRDLLAG